MNWRDRAACRPDPASIDATDPEQFYATFKSENQWADALSFCGRCDVTAECLAFALEHETPSTVDGMWGGMTPEERRDLLRARGVAEPTGTPQSRDCVICTKRFETFVHHKTTCSEACKAERVRLCSAEYRRAKRARAKADA